MSRDYPAIYVPGMCTRCAFLGACILPWHIVDILSPCGREATLPLAMVHLRLLPIIMLGKSHFDSSLHSICDTPRMLQALAASQSMEANFLMKTSSSSTLGQVRSWLVSKIQQSQEMQRSQECNGLSEQDI